MTQGTARRIAWSLWTLTFVLSAGLGALGVATGGLTEDWGFAILAFLSVMGYVTVGALIASRHPGNAIGWLFLYFGITFFAGMAADEYTVRGMREALPGTSAAVLVNQIVFPLAFGALPLILLLFPSGRLPSPRWRLAPLGVVVSVLAATAGILLQSGSLAPGVTNPLGVESLSLVTAALRVIGAVGAFSFSLLSVVGMFLRYRRVGREERQQIRWLAYVGGIAATLLLLLFSSEWIAPGAGDPLWIAFFVTIALGIPAASAIAILRYRIYDLDIVVRKTVVFGILAAFITLGYVLVVIGIPTLLFGVGGGVENAVPFMAAAVLALVFQPVRNAARRLANRLVYGKRATPYELLAEFAGRAGGTYSVEDVLPRMARAAGEGTGSARASVWLRVGQELRRSAVWPSGWEEAEVAVPLSGPDLPKLPDEDRTFPVRHQDELLGALGVSASAAEPLTPTTEKLLEDLAAQAALILRNVRLTEELKANLEELRASRQRLVAAQDEERRRLERDIHDGAQQQLVALAVNLNLARTLTEKDPPKAAEILDRLRAEAQEALEDLRDLARGIYPPLLQDKGLAAAVESQARKAAVPVTVDADGIGRYPQEAEAAAYFCVLEALQNVAKYAEAEAVTVRLGEVDGELVFSVTDDGNGFDPDTTRPGSGLQNMRDRLEALGGRLEIRSTPGEGTIVLGRVPVGEGL
jgi:signal transduction histidine kinase